MVDKYAATEMKFPVTLKDPESLRKRGCKVVERDLVSEADYIRHDPKKLSAVIADFVGGWIQ